MSVNPEALRPLQALFRLVVLVQPLAGVNQIVAWYRHSFCAAKKIDRLTVRPWYMGPRQARRVYPRPHVACETSCARISTKGSARLATNLLRELPGRR